MSSIFTKIINREIPSDIVYETNDIIVIKDINPQAKIHLLIIPKKHIETIDHLEETDKSLIADMFFVAKKVAFDLGVTGGYKLHFNVGKAGGQEVMHLHLHLLSNI
ncbi:histidine triad nucleotide-binding protein [Candidatus Gracilibacteria bacterium]|nr:histidine triad nucleotide-binding protein [Candidatus Gracilibacteria bacterium]